MKLIQRLPGYLRAVSRARRRLYDLPRMLTYIVTFSCNARCIMCDSWKMTAKGDLKLDEIERIFDQLPQMDAIRLTGGEPFGRKDLLEIAHLAQRQLRPLMLHVTTNGFLTDRIVEFCERRDKAVPLNVLISLDGVEEKHNQVRGRETAWETATRTLRELAAHRKEWRLSLAVNQTIVDAEGLEHYRKLREFLRPLGVNHNMVMAYDSSSTYKLDKKGGVAPSQIGQFTTFGEFSQDTLKELLTEVERDLEGMPAGYRLAKRYYLRGIANRLLNDEQSPKPKCVALTTHMRLFPNGDVPTCQFNGKVVGNLREQRFEEVWTGVRAEELRKWVRKCPGCWAECEVLPSAVYTGDLLRGMFRPPRRLFPEIPNAPAPAPASD